MVMEASDSNMRKTIVALLYVANLALLGLVAHIVLNSTVSMTSVALGLALSTMLVILNLRLTFYDVEQRLTLAAACISAWLTINTDSWYSFAIVSVGNLVLTFRPLGSTKTFG